MKKNLSNKTLMKEASLWTELKKALREQPAKTCHKWKGWKSWRCRSGNQTKKRGRRYAPPPL